MAKMSKDNLIYKRNNPIKWTFFTAVLITLFINPKLADPFNAPKLYLLICGTTILLGFLFFSGDNLFRSMDSTRILVVIFICAIGIGALLTDVKYQALFGDSLRQTGFIAYFGFAVYLLTVYKFFRLDSKHFFYIAIGALGFIFPVYGIVQYTGNDPFPWINQYNPIILTLGNPNFTGALMAILATLTFSFIFDKQLLDWQKIFFLAITLGLVLTIYLSNARQGLLSLLIGLGLFISFKLLKKNIVLGSISLFGLLSISILAIAGILQKGPLERYLYKDSVSLRGHYWRAGLKMFRENVFSGVGIDSYGNYFKLYRDSIFPVRYGYDLTSNNAHNVPIQLFATGGIFVGLSYLAIVFLIIYNFVKGFKRLDGGELNILCGAFAAWLAFQSQSIVSIDNIGLTIWGWILGGLILALTKVQLPDSHTDINKSKFQTGKSSKNQSLRQAFTGALLIVAIILVAKLTQSESLMFKIRGDLNSASSNQNTALSELNSIINDPFAQPWYKATSADTLYQLGFKTQAIQSMELILKIDQNNAIYLNVLASMYENTNEYEKAINLRIKSSKYDPYNVKNYLQLARLYKVTGKTDRALEMKRKINELDPVSEFTKIVNNEIV
jgi:O-antigen ligase